MSCTLDDPGDPKAVPHELSNTRKTRKQQRETMEKPTFKRKIIREMSDLGVCRKLMWRHLSASEGQHGAEPFETAGCGLPRTASTSQK